MGRVVNGVYVSDNAGITEKQRVEEAMQYYGQNGMVDSLDAAWKYYQTLDSGGGGTPQINDSITTSVPKVSDKAPTYNNYGAQTMNPSAVTTGGAAQTGYGQAMTSYLNSINGSWGYDPLSNSVLVNGKQFNWNGSGYGIPGVSWDPGTQLNYVSDPQAFLAGTGLNGLVQTNQTNQVLQQMLGQQPMSAQEMQAMIMGMVQQPTWAQGISYDQGLEQAVAALGPKYALSLKDVLGKLANDQISRGFYGQLPADVVTQDAAARMEAEKNSAVAAQATDLVNQSANQAYQQNSLNQSLYQTQLSAALQAVQAQQQAEQNRLSGLLSLLGIQNDQANNSGQMNLSTTQLLGSMTSQAKNDALARWQSAGKIISQADADLLGMPIGTSTEEALYHAASLAAANRGGSGGSGGSGKTDDWTGDVQDILAGYFESKLGYNTAIAQLNGLLAAGKINDTVYNSAVNQIVSNFNANNPPPVIDQDGTGSSFRSSFLRTLLTNNPGRLRMTTVL